MKHLRYKLGFMIYWLFFAVLSVYSAKDPGYVINPELIPFPWLALVFVWVLLAILITSLYLVLKPVFLYNSVSRLLIVFAISCTLTFTCIFTMNTDMPGLYYIPQNFLLVTLLILSISVLYRGARFIFHTISGIINAKG